MLIILISILWSILVHSTSHTSAKKTLSYSSYIGDIYSLHHGWLSNWLSRKVGCPDDAEDLSQDTFVRVLSSSNACTFKEPRAYLLVVASRLLINRNRRKKVEEEVIRQVAVILEGYENRCPDKTIIAKDLLSKVVMLLTEELPEKPRKAFYMAKIDGLTYKEIAMNLSVSESSVKQYLARVLAHCHKRLYTSD